MALISFKDRIIDLAGSLGSADDDAIQQWIIDGCYDVILKVKASVPSDEFSLQSSAYTGPMSVSLTGIRDIILVQRDNYRCAPITADKINYVDPNHILGANSIYKATSRSPVFYIKDNTLNVKPNPTASEQGYYSYIPEYSISNWDSVSSSIPNFPNRYYEHVILYASIKTLDRQLLDLMANTDIDAAITAAKDAITKSGQYLDGSGATTTNVVTWLNEEDSEMASSVMAAVSAELSTMQASVSEVKTRMERDLQRYQWYQEKRTNLQQEYLSKFPQMGNKGGQ